MADTPTAGDLVGAVAGVLQGDRTTVGAAIADAAQRARAGVADVGGGSPRRTDADPAPVPKRMPQPTPGRESRLRLSNGRRVRATITPAVARRADLSAIARVAAENDRRAFAALRGQRRAIEGLARSQADLARQVGALQQLGGPALIGVLRGLADLDPRLAGVVTQAQTALAAAPPPGAPATPSTAAPSPPGGFVRRQRLPRAQQMQAIREARLLATRMQIQAATSVVNSVQAAAYGQKGTLLSTNNLLLAGNQLFWSLLDPLLQRVHVLNAASATVLAALAPLGTLLAGQVLLGDRQHVRFVSGVVTLDNTGAARQSLRGMVAEALWSRFFQRTDVPVTTTIVDPPNAGTTTVVARVVQGVLQIRVPSHTYIAVLSPQRQVRVAWTVDTGEDVG